MSELSDYKRIIEAPMIAAFNEKIKGLRERAEAAELALSQERATVAVERGISDGKQLVISQLETELDQSRQREARYIDAMISVIRKLQQVSSRQWLGSRAAEYELCAALGDNVECDMSEAQIRSVLSEGAPDER